MKKEITKDRVIKAFTKSIRNKFKKRLKKIILFGSRARGDFSPESDYDFILVFDRISSIVKKYLSNLGAEFLLKHSAVITDIAVTENDLKKMKYEPFIMNAQKEGVVL